ncbi:MAG: hypothetical protein NBV57_01205 [Algoriphagus sp.]|nr:hypothetical protein [Algoriphagus sp.]
MKINLGFISVVLAFFTQSCADGNTQVQGRQPNENSKIDSIFLAGIPQGKLTNPLLEEVSGLVVSQRYPNRLYVHTDSGGEAAVFVLDTLGNELGKLELSGLSNRDWEDIAIGPGPNGSSYIYVAEIGDNEAKYNQIYLYRFLEPEQFQAIPSGAINRVSLQFPGGPKDAEAFLVDPISGELYLVSKREAKNTLYRVPADGFEKGNALLEKLHSFDFTSSVGADVSRDGSQILIKNYLQVFYWTRQANQSLSEALQVPPLRLPYLPEPQGEAIGFNYKGDAYYTLSEKRNGIIPTLYRYPKK